MQKKDILKRLEGNEPFRDALRRITNDAERNAIEAVAKQMVLDMVQAVAPILDAQRTDIDDLEVATELRRVFSGSVSGSNGTT
jgi:hypothetical protein